MNDSNESSALDRDIARLVLAMLWCAVGELPGVLDAPTFEIVGYDGPCDADTAATWLATKDKPVWVRAQRLDEGQVQLASGSPPALPQTSQDPSLRAGKAERFAYWMERFGAESALIIAAGQVFFASIAVLRQMAEDYWLSPLVAESGGPAHDSWVKALELPASWLKGVGWVFTVGRFRSNGVSTPLLGRDRWNEAIVHRV